MAYPPPAGDAVALIFIAGYTPPAGDAIALGGEIAEEQPTWPAQQQAGYRILWGQQTPVDRVSPRIAWTRKKPVNRTYTCGFKACTGRTEKRVTAPWKQLTQKQRQVTSSWGTLTGVGRTTRTFWKYLSGYDREVTSSWGKNYGRDTTLTVPWISLTPRDRRKQVPWGTYPPNDKTLTAPWLSPPPKDKAHITAWGKGYYDRICTQDYDPPAGDNVPIVFRQKLSETGDGNHVNLTFSKATYDIRCSQREPSGWRDNYFYDKNGETVTPDLPDALDLNTYIMISTASLTRLPDGMAIPVKSMTLSLDWDSAHWGISATVIDGDVRDLSPTDDGPIEIEAEIVGNTWHCIVDDWQRNRGFAVESRSIRGRGLSALLASPFAPKDTGIETEERTSVQLCAAQLEYTGWSIDSSAWTDWNIPAGVASWTDAAPIDIIKRVANAAGGFVRPQTNAQVLELVPKFKAKPWEWTSADADLLLPAAMMIKDNGQWDGRDEGNICYLIGSNGTWSVKRTGTAGDEVAGEVYSDLITADEAARAMGIYTIGRCGKWQKHTLNLPIFADQEPGLILPGTILWFAASAAGRARIQTIDGIGGVVTAVEVTANWTKGGLIVRQQVSLEVYCGN